MQKMILKKQCACCRKEADVAERVSAYIEDTGLDQRPKYEYLLSEIQECPNCHYCSFDIEEPVMEKVREEVYTEEYQSAIKDERFDIDERRLNAAIKLAEKDKEKADLYLNACWKQEFKGNKNTADIMREKAAACMEKMFQEAVRFELVLLYLDCLRQLKRYEEATVLINEIEEHVIQNLEPDEIPYQVFCLEKKLIADRDHKPHMMSEV